MSRKNSYNIIKNRIFTEKAKVLEGLKDSQSSKHLKRFNLQKYVFEVDRRATKTQIKEALEQIYKKDKIKIISVNTIITKSKPRFFKRIPGSTKQRKKAIITLREGDKIEE